MSKCSACPRETAFTYSAEMWRRLDVADTTPAYVCQECRLDIGLEGRLSGVGWTWFKAELERRKVDVPD